MRPLTEIERVRFEVIEKMTVIVGHCELLELQAESHEECIKRLEKIKALAMNGAEALRAFLRTETTEEQQELLL